jgi:hypothetical protein
MNWPNFKILIIIPKFHKIAKFLKYLHNKCKITIRIFQVNQYKAKKVKIKKKVKK